VEGSSLSTISIRPARLEDAGEIAHVHVESWRSTYAGILPDKYLAGLDETLRERLWREWLSGETFVLVAEKNGHVVGFAHAGAIREEVEACDAQLYAIYLLKEAQGLGIGTALLRGIVAELTDRNFKSLAVWVLERNRSRVFYEKTGAHLANSKVIEIGGLKLLEVAYRWDDLGDFKG
jgi:GNAT superfamily N-acetyltransferase